jgi:hypothetical protein
MPPLKKNVTYIQAAQHPGYLFTGVFVGFQLAL